MRINEKIGANVSLHDLRHTLGLWLIADPEVTLVDVQQVMRHRQITTTGVYLRPWIDEVIAKVHDHYTRTNPQPRPMGGWSYDPRAWSRCSGRPDEQPTWQGGAHPGQPRRPGRVGPQAAATAAVIETDLHLRRKRAEEEGWLGEIEGIDLTLSFFNGKREEALRLSRIPTIQLGMPRTRGEG